MADKEEVEPTEESAAAEPSDVSNDLEPAAAHPIEPAAEDDESETSSSGAHALNADDFDEIVRDSGIDDRLAEPDSPNADPSSPDSPGPESANGEEKALEPVGAGARVSNSGAAARERSARKAKEAATRRRDQPVKVVRTGPAKFVRESIGELRKVVYPTGQQLINYFIVVLVFVLFIIAYVSLLDLGLGALIFRIFS